MTISLFAGFALGFSLIMAIGSQNAFILRQGLRGQHVLPVVLVCAASDAILIAVGVWGFDSLATVAPLFETVMRFGGAAFLFWYGTRSFLAAWRGGATLSAAQGGADALWPVLVTTLALTWLNPHVYLDTVVMLGALAAQYPSPGTFGLGAALASFTFFLCLGFGARLAAPFFAHPKAWQVLDACIGAMMWSIAIWLIKDANLLQWP